VDVGWDERAWTDSRRSPVRVSGQVAVPPEYSYQRSGRQPER